VDGAGGAARFGVIPGVAADAAGNVYLADHNNYTVRRVTPDGTVTTLAGRAGERGCFDGVGGEARFMLPTALAVDRAGNVAVADGDAIRRVTPRGAVETLRPAGARFGRLDGIACDRAGNLYAADRGNQVIWKVSADGRASRLGGSALAMGGSGWLVTGLAVDGRGNVYVSDAVRSCIVRGRPLRRRRRGAGPHGRCARATRSARAGTGRA
jgi:sugar lactone lactonase YvrE